MNKKNTDIIDFLNLFESYINKCNVYDTKDIFSIHNNINNYVNNNSNLEVNMINNYIEKYKKNDNEQIKKIKIFLELKNNNLIKEAKKLDSWNKTIDNLCEKYNNINKGYKDDNLKKNMEKSFKKLLLESKYKFNGNWDIILLNKQGLPSKIELIDPKYIDIIFSNIK